MDRDKYRIRPTEEGYNVEITPPDDVVESLQPSNDDLDRAHDATRLVLRYSRDSINGLYRTVPHDELEADLLAAQSLLENPPSFAVHDSVDTSAMVAAAALEAYLVEGAGLPDDAIAFAAEIVLEIGEVETWSRPFEYEGTYNEQAADRSSARALPMLLLPVATRLRAVVDEEEESTSLERAVVAGVNLARAVADEVRLHLARGLDHVWKTPCTEHGPCHHELGLRIATETMRSCLLGPWDPETGRRSVLELEEPFNESLASAADNSIRVSKLDAAIRALAPAVTANTCVSSRARDLLPVLLAAQRRLVACLRAPWGS